MDKKSRARTNDLFASLLSLPHRGTCTKEESLAFSQVSEFLKKEGFSVNVERFPCPRSYGWELLSLCLLSGVGGLIPSTPLALLSGIWFILYFSGLGTPWDRIFARGESQNLYTETGTGKNTLILMAHLDSAKTAAIFHPRWVRFFRLHFFIQTVFLFGLCGATVLSFTPVARLLGIFFLVQGFMWLYRELTSPYVQGANDNLSGVITALELFLIFHNNPLPNTRTILLLTGGEEVGMQGAKFYLRSHPPLPGTVIVNIDNVGAGELLAVQGEGMLWVIPYRGALARVIAPRHLPLHIYRLAYFDALPFARRNYETLTLVRLKRGIPPHWHWISDREENLEEGAISETIAEAEKIIRERFSSSAL